MAEFVWMGDQPFRVLKKLGEGGHGTVALVDHNRLGRVAYKTCPGASGDQRAELMVEAEQHRTLRHPNIVILYDTVFNSMCCGLFLEYMKYGSVIEFIENFKIPLEWRIHILNETACGMFYLHGNQPSIIHGDLSSHNILIGEGFHAKIADFGLSRTLKEKYEKSTTVTPLRGKPIYIAPEYFKDPRRRKSEKFDVYGFAISAWEILSQKRAYYDFVDNNLIMIYVQRGERPDIKELDVSISSTVQQLIEKCWHQNDKERPGFEFIKDQLYLLVSNLKSEIQQAYASLMDQEKMMHLSNGMETCEISSTGPIIKDDQTPEVNRSTDTGVLNTASMFRNQASGGKSTGYDEPDNLSRQRWYEEQLKDFVISEDSKVQIPVGDKKTMGHDITGDDFSQVQINSEPMAKDIDTASMFRNQASGGKSTGYDEPDNLSRQRWYEEQLKDFVISEDSKVQIPVGDKKTMGHDITGDDFSQVQVNPEPMAKDIDYFRGANDLEIDMSLLKKECKIGEGNFGIVYKGTYKNGEVAIKEQKHAEQFSKEKSLASLRNPYLVPVLGFNQQNSILVLLFPLMFMDLKQALDGQMELSCKEKLRIIYHVSEALKFLHKSVCCRGPIIHGDVKPGNSLLDVRKNARLGDAGLASVMLPDQTHYSTDKTCGTEGYKDPHQGASKNCKSVYNDLFSFGIVILQILKWQPAVITKTENKYNFLTTSSVTLFENLLDKFKGIPSAEIYCNNLECFDKDTWHTVDSETCILDITRIALCCIDTQDKRPTANLIADKLRTWLLSLHFPLYEYDDQNEKCLSCCINTAVHNDCCQKKLVCQICASSSQLNPIYCPDHGKVGLHFEVDCCAILVSGTDYEDKHIQACFNRDMENMSEAIEDFASVGLKKENIHKFNLSECNSYEYEQTIENIVKKLEEYHGKKPELLIFYYSGHAFRKSKMLISRDKSDRVGISAEKLKQNFEQIKSKRLLAILDCCYAGKFDLLPDNCDDDDMHWQIQMNSTNSRREADMDPSGDDDNRLIYSSTFTRCFIAAFGCAQYCPMSRIMGLNCHHCDIFKTFVSIKNCIDVEHIYKFVQGHMYFEDKMSRPNISLKNFQGDTMIAYSGSMRFQFRFIGVDEKETPIYLEKLGSSVNEILKQLFTEACNLGLLTKSCGQTLQLIGNRKADEYEISTKQDVGFNCLFRGGPKVRIRRNLQN